MKSALITGAAGFIGRHLVPCLEAEGYAVTKVDPLWLACSSRFEDCDFGDHRFDVIVHLGATIVDLASRMVPGLTVYDDIALDLAVAKYVREFPPLECFIYPSSCAVDWPEDPYAWVKLTGERFCMALHKQGVPVVILRPFSGYGPDQSPAYPFRAILDRALKHEDPLVVWGSGTQIRDFVYIDDLVDAFIWAIHKAPRGKPLEIGTGIATPMLLLAHKISRAVGYEPLIKSDPSKPSSSPKRVADPYEAGLRGWTATVSLGQGIARAIYTITGKDLIARALQKGKGICNTHGEFEGRGCPKCFAA